jgi:hypothetical protein
MKQREHQAIAPFILVVGTVCTLMLIACPPFLARAGGGEPNLPPRYPPPTQPTDDDDDDDKDIPIGAYIELQAASAPSDAWTVVQWQDRAGGWHDVEGWQGTLEPDGSKRWWVSAKDFGTGPFRWIVTDRQGGQLLAISAPFSLPAVANEIVWREVSLGR